MRPAKSSGFRFYSRRRGRGRSRAGARPWGGSRAAAQCRSLRPAPGPAARLGDAGGRAAKTPGQSNGQEALGRRGRRLGESAPRHAHRGPFPSASVGAADRPGTGSDHTGLPARPPGRAGLPSGPRDLKTGGPRGRHVHSCSTEGPPPTAGSESGLTRHGSPTPVSLPQEAACCFVSEAAKSPPRAGVTVATARPGGQSACDPQLPKSVGNYRKVGKDLKNTLSRCSTCPQVSHLRAETPDTPFGALAGPSSVRGHQEAGSCGPCL